MLCLCEITYLSGENKELETNANLFFKVPAIFNAPDFLDFLCPFFWVSVWEIWPQFSVVFY